MTSLTTGRLPVQMIPMIGRRSELRDVMAALSGSRLLTLTGPGGTGKTRLALAAADAARASFSQGVCWIELAPVDDPTIVALTVAGGLGAHERPGQDIIETVAEHLGDRQVLIVLDNCEHITAAAADLAARLLRACPELSVLATSREVLGVDGERQLAVPTLPEADAVSFFEQRAQLVRPSFRLDDENVAAVRQVCRRLDGLPLAIELAAARLRILSVGQLAERLDDVFSVLVGGSRTSPRRHQTLRATLDWSHDLLDDDERAAFRRLAVFAGGFTLAAAEQVVGGTDLGADPVLDLLTRLADKSLLRVDYAGDSTGSDGSSASGGSSDEVRYHLLATVRDYAKERLAQASEEDLARGAHLRYYADFVEQIEPRIGGGMQVPDTSDLESELNRIEAETPNLRTALEFARTARDVRGALRIVGPLERYAYLRGQYSEVRHWMDAAVTIGSNAPARLLAKGLLGGGRLALLQCDYAPAVGRLEAALRLYRELEDPRGIARTLQVLGSVAREQGRYARSTELHTESLAIASAAGDRSAVASAHGYLGFTAWLQGEFELAASECEAALALSRALGDVEGIAWSLLSLGIVARYTGELDRAFELLSESQSVSEKVGFREGVAWSLEQLGLLSVSRGDRVSAVGLLHASLDLHRDLRDRWRICSVLDDLAALEAAASPVQAAKLLAAAQALREEIGTAIAPCEAGQHQQTVAAARAALGDAGFETAWRAGLATAIADLQAPQPEPEPGPVPAQPGQPAQPAQPELAPAPSAGTPSLRITALGSAVVYRGDAAITAAEWGYAKPRELFFLLATSSPLTRDQIGLALWPESSRDRLGNALHTALRELRKALGDADWIRYSGGRYSFNAEREHESDIETFERSLAAARRARPASEALPDLQRAIAAYGGDFLDGVAAGEWAQARRDELRRAFESALLAAGRLYAAAGRHQAAVTSFRRAIGQEPLNESAHRELMASLAAQGEKARAIKHYEEFAERLKAQVDVAPAAETTALYHHLRNS
jgi:predicted ATPase/DNA-binding SARP family transcriptional activator